MMRRGERTDPHRHREAYPDVVRVCAVEEEATEPMEGLGRMQDEGRNRPQNGPRQAERDGPEDPLERRLVNNCPTHRKDGDEPISFARESGNGD